MSKLTKLVRRQGLFDDPTDEINGLIFTIKQDLDKLNSKCDSAQQFVDDNKRRLGQKNQSASHNVTVVSQLKSELMNATKDFKSVLELRSSKMKDQQQKKVQLTGIGTLSPLRQFAASSAVAQSNTTSNPMQPQTSGSSNPISYQNSNINGDDYTRLKSYPPSPYQMVSSEVGRVVVSVPSSSSTLSSPAPSHLSLNPGQPQYMQQQLLLAPPATQQYFESREQAVTEVEKTIGELGKLYRRLAAMISEQQELVERIDQDIESAVSNTENAQSALLRTYESVSSNRGLYMKLFAILTIFILFFVLFLM